MLRKALIGILIVILFFGILIAGVSLKALGAVVYASPETQVSGIITSNTTWTKENSPYILTGNVLVYYGVTLTIEHGVTINFDDYYIMVNGTLCAQGSISDKIYFKSGRIIFTTYSNGWNDSTGSGCIIENAILNLTSITSDNSLKISNNFIINSSISVGDSSIISNNYIKGYISAGNLSTITNNNIMGDVSVGSSSLISYNILTGGITAGDSSIVSNNTIIKPTGRYTSSIAIDVGNSAIVSNNTVEGNVYARSALISNNTIIGGGMGMDFWGRPTYPLSAIYILGSSKVSNNNITSKGNGYGITIEVGSNASICNNLISGFYYGIDAAGTAIIEKNRVIKNDGGGIAIGKMPYSYSGWLGDGNIVIRDNIIANNGLGIGGPVPNTNYGISYGKFTSTVTIEKNLIAKNTDGLRNYDFIRNIQNNTIAYNSIGIYSETTTAIIIYNNIQNNSNYNFYLATSSNVNATYNWWGTTNETLIIKYVYDYYDDFQLGKVNYTPFLTEPNPCAPQDRAPPNTNVDYDGKWRSVDFTIALTATDHESGVAETYYRINNGSIKAVSVDGQPLITTEGDNNTLEYWSVDRTGNEELPHKVLTGIKLDKSAPVIGAPSHTPSGDVPPNQDVKVSVNVSDSLSGVKNVILSYNVGDGSSWLNVTMGFNSATNLYEATIPGQQEGTVVKYKIIAYDNAGNLKVQDNNTLYYRYIVIPEYSSAIVLMLMLIIPTLFVVILKRKTNSDASLSYVEIYSKVFFCNFF